jgi:hypothetical protein
LSDHFLHRVPQRVRVVCSAVYERDPLKLRRLRAVHVLLFAMDLWRYSEPFETGKVKQFGQDDRGGHFRILDFRNKFRSCITFKNASVDRRELLSDVHENTMVHFAFSAVKMITFLAVFLAFSDVVERVRDSKRTVALRQPGSFWSPINPRSQSGTARNFGMLHIGELSTSCHATHCAKIWPDKA